MSPCSHTLFVAHDEDFEFRSDRFEIALSGTSSADDRSELSIDDLTDQIEIPDSLKIAAYVAAPSFFGTYVGFAPVA